MTHGIWELGNGQEKKSVKVSGHLSSNSGEIVLQWALEGKGIMPVSYTHLDVYKRQIIYHTMFDNMQKAIDLNRPACQDTGEIMFFVKVGSRFPLLGELQSILKQAVEEATVKAPLRHNAVEIFDEVNTGKNTGSGVPWVTWDIIPDNDDAEIEVYMAGGGCTLPGRSKVLMPSEGYEGVVKFVFENISTLAVNACPPVLVGVGIATSVETAAVLSRKAILRPIGKMCIRDRRKSLKQWQDLTQRIPIDVECFA